MPPQSELWVPCDDYTYVLIPSTSELWYLAGLCLYTESSQEMLRERTLRQSQVLATDHGGMIFWQHDRNPLLFFCISLYGNPWKAKKQPLIKQSVKLYVVIKCHQSTEHHMQKNKAEGLSSFHMHWSFLFLFSGKFVQNDYVTVFPLYSRLFLGYGKDVQFLSYLQIFPSALLQT